MHAIRVNPLPLRDIASAHQDGIADLAREPVLLVRWTCAGLTGQRFDFSRAPSVLCDPWTAGEQGLFNA
jgi:hypothetical protein